MQRQVPNALDLFGESLSSTGAQAREIASDQTDANLDDWPRVHMKGCFLSSLGNHELRVRNHLYNCIIEARNESTFKISDFLIMRI